MSVNAKMTAIADNIRLLTGVSDAMGLDAMATNLSKVNTDISDAFTALTEKGVTVPNDAKVDALAPLIAAIESGGSNVQVVTGTYTVATNTKIDKTFTITHNAGFIPKLFVIFTTGAITTSYGFLSGFVVIDSSVEPSESGSRGFSTGQTYTSNTYYTGFSRHVLSWGSGSGHSYIAVTPETIKIMGGDTYTSGAKLIAGKTYVWYAFSDWEGIL